MKLINDEMKTEFLKNRPKQPLALPPTTTHLALPPALPTPPTTPPLLHPTKNRPMILQPDKNTRNTTTKI